MKEIDVGFTHVAFVVRDLERSIAFYERYADMTVIHRREPDVPDARKVAWLSDRTRPFALVLVQADNVTDTPLGNFGHRSRFGRASRPALTSAPASGAGPSVALV